MDKELPVSVWPEWKIIEKIGEGSFGKVYKAQRTEKGYSFYSAIKIITIPASRGELDSVRSETEDEKSTREYFENVVEECIQEVSTMEYFRGNSHIVSVEDFKVVEYLDEIGWDIYIRMEYLTSFTDYCAGNSLTEKEVVRLGIDLCRALEYCGQLNIIHRDIKPENVFVSRFGDFKLGDFGIARELERTMSGFSKKGTYSYMAPEMYRGESYDRRVDIYSLGIVLYRLLNHNRLPFLNLEKQLITYRDKENALTRRMSGEEFPKPADGSNEFAHIIRRACAYRPEERYQHPEAFRKALEDLQSRCAAGNTEADPVQEHREADFATEDAGAKILTYKEDSQEKTKTGEILPGNWERLLESGAPGQRRHGAKHDRRSTVRWVAIIVAVGLFVCFGAGAYLKRMVEDTIRVQTEKMVSALESDKYGTAKDTEEDFATSIEVIKDRATAIVEEMDSYQLEGREEQRLRYYNKEGEIMKVLVYPSWSEDGVYEEYYYWNGALFFAYIWEGEKTELYYYRDGMLIRWIDENGVPHDNEFDNDEYNRRGDKYWSNSIEQLR